MNLITKSIIFTDLDATLLDHYDYSYHEAEEMLRFIDDNQIPLIFTTSKTAVEVIELQRIMGISEPFIVENGGGIFIPHNYKRFNVEEHTEKDGYKVIELGKTYCECKHFFKTHDYFDVRTFSNMSPYQISRLTKLDNHHANMAKQRDFSEPFVLNIDEQLSQIEEEAAAQGFKITKGGRFFHLMGEKQDKGVAVKRVVELFADTIEEEPYVIALGDSKNDIQMLQAADLPILIPRHDETFIALDLPNLVRARYKSSKGWNSSLKELFNV